MKFHENIIWEIIYFRMKSNSKTVRFFWKNCLFDDIFQYPCCSHLKNLISKWNFD
jgi:hypothetical protein